MAKMGFCPSGRLFEAAACGTPILSDWWEGLDAFFSPGSEILVARETSDSVAALALAPSELRKIADAGRERALTEHTAGKRAKELEVLLEKALRSEPQTKTNSWMPTSPQPAPASTSPNL